MPISGQIQVHKARERGSVSIPFESFIDSRGAIKFDKAINRGLVEVRQGRTGLVLKIGGIVGRLPLNDRHALDISPKFSMENLTRLVALSDHSFSKHTEITRLYETTNPDGFLPELLLKSFSIALQKAQAEGRHRQYQKRTGTTPIRPRINFQKSAQTLWSKGQLTSAVTDQFYYTQDNIENQILKHGCLIGHALCRFNNDLRDEADLFGRTLAEYSAVSQKSDRELLGTYDPGLNRLPAFKIWHRKAVQIAIELIRRSGISYDRFDTGVELPSFLINLDDVFESYIRNILRSGLRRIDPQITVGDGNLPKWQKPLFDDTKKGLAKPDFLVTKAGTEKPLIVGDVKYKRENDIGAGDRYQVISHAYSHQCKTALIISPAVPGKSSDLIRVGRIGGSSSGLEVFHYSMDISSDLESSEAKLVKEVYELA